MRYPQVLTFGVAVALAVGCGASAPTLTDPSDLEAGALIARDSLTTVNGTALPCCTKDSSGVRTTITAGAMTFYAAALYSDTVFTPSGPMSGACVHQSPNGSVMARNGLLTLVDGSNYLTLPCSRGVYRVSITELVEHQGTPSVSREVIIATGVFAWAPGSLTLNDASGGSPPASSMAGANIRVTTFDFFGNRHRHARSVAGMAPG